MAQLSKQVLETLWQDSEFVLSRASLTGESKPMLLLSPASAHPPTNIITRLEHAYALREDLDPSSMARPVRLVTQGGVLTLLLEDPGGGLLAKLVGQPWDVRQFLRVAISIAVALGRLHGRGLIHDDVNPANILVDSSTDEAWLIGVCFMSRPALGQVVAPLHEIAGRLAYMAPERTGRMNRSVDARSDLYSFGVTLYEMLTGVLPFTANDPMEWVHSHIARQPMPPDQRVTGIPGVLSAIIMKLLNKTVEERYQTAGGVEADLRRCLAAWDTEGRIDLFPLCTKDISDRLLISEKLYGRDQECRALREAFERVVASGKPELLLVSGYSGIGKSSVVNEFYRHLVPRGVLFASGKFEQYKRDIPYATLAQAFETLIHQILAGNDIEVSYWQEALRSALGPRGQVLFNLIPALEFVIGEQPPIPELAPQEAHNRFQMVFQRFIGAFARPEQPLILFLDDLQWLDTATLELFERLIVDPEMQYILFIGAYRNNEVSPSHPLVRTLEFARTAGARVQEIVLNPLGFDDVGKLVSDALQCERSTSEPLAELVHEKTGGNPFFAIEFLGGLAEEHLLCFNSAKSEWTWDLAGIRSKGYTDNLVEFMTGKLERLPQRTQEALGLLACFGNMAEIATLALVRGETEEETNAALWDAVRSGLIFRLERAYMFLHDRVREAAYAISPESERAAAHLRIGRLLAARTAPEEQEGKIFEIVNQLNRGSELIGLQEERDQAAELNLIAGNRAKRSTGYASALAYLAAGRRLLGENSWERCHSLTFTLEFQRAECEFLTGDFAAAEERLCILSNRADDLRARASIARLQTELYTSVDQCDRAVSAALEYLRQVGIDWSLHPADEEVRQEYDRVWQRLGTRPIEALINLPPMTDPSWRAILDVLTALDEPAYFVDQNLRYLVVARMVNISLEHGNSDGSSVAYAHLGRFMGSRFGDYQAGFRFGKLGFDLAEKHGAERLWARVAQTFGYFIIPWARHLRTSVDLLRRSFFKAQEAGDLKYAVYACDRLSTVLLAAGEPLAEIQAQAERAIEFARRANFAYVVDIIVGQLRFIRTLRGLTPNLSSFNDAEFDEGRFEKRMEAKPHSVFATCWYWIRKMRALFYAGHYEAALAAAAKAEPLLLPEMQHFEVAEYLFYSALARAGAYDSSLAEERAVHRGALAVAHRQMSTLAENCPENFGCCAALIAAEIARIEGREVDAERLYEAAIQSAREHGYVQNEAVAHETAAQFYARRGLQTVARVYLQDARILYSRWGAIGKVKQLELRYPGFRDSARASSLALEQVDVQALARASQAVSSELDLSKLIETLLVIALQDAGAQRGVLILLRGDEPQIEAEATTGPDAIAVRFCKTPPTSEELPDSLLRYVIRTQESIILDDASAPNQFSPDKYVQKKQARSVLCLPLIKQASVKGALYLENNLASHVFTPDRVSILRVLVSQASISIDHARLVAELTQEIAERKRAEEELRKREASLREAQTELAHITRLTTMGELAASIAHEVNQPLAGIVMNGSASLRWLAGASPNLAEAREAIQRIIRDGSRAGHVIARIRALSKKARGSKELLDINEVIQEIVVLTGEELRRNEVALQMKLGAGLPLVMGDRIQLQQVVMNLILNSVEAMRGVDEHERNLIIKTVRLAGDEVKVAVDDSGIGLDPQNLEQIFDAFYTTKPGGLGMGLSISRSIVENHGGRLWVEPNAGPGVTFQFTLHR
jgi:predicted ATPase/signal transduction histidine kinase